MKTHKFQHISVSNSNCKVDNYILEIISNLNDFFFLDQSKPDFYLDPDEISLNLYNKFYDAFPSLPFLYTSFIEDTVPFTIVKENFFTLSDADLHPSVLKYENSDYLFYERKPFKASISYKDAKADSKKVSHSYTFWVPWTLYCFSKNNYYDITVLFSDKELQSFEDSYLLNFFPNSYSDGKICIGMSSSLARTSFDQGNKIRFESFINDYWSGGWNNDLPSSFEGFLFNLKSYITEDNYPIISSYVYFSEEVLSRFKDYFSTPRFKKLVNNRKIKDYNHSYSYDRILSFLSILTLEETLMFFAEIKSLYSFKNENNYLKTFDKISKNYSYSDSSLNFCSSRLSVKSILGDKTTDIDASTTFAPNRKEDSSIIFVVDENYFKDRSNDNSSSFGFYVNDYHLTKDNHLPTSNSVIARNVYNLNHINEIKFINFFKEKTNSCSFEIFSSLSNLDSSHLFVLHKEDQSYNLLSKISFYDLYFIIEKIVDNEDYTDFFSSHKDFVLTSKTFSTNSFDTDCGKFIKTFNLVRSQFEYSKSFDYVNKHFLHSLFTMFSSMIVVDFYYYFNNYFLETKEESNNDNPSISINYIEV